MFLPWFVSICWKSPINATVRYNYKIKKKLFSSPSLISGFFLYKIYTHFSPDITFIISSFYFVTCSNCLFRYCWRSTFLPLSIRPLIFRYRDFLHDSHGILYVFLIRSQGNRGIVVWTPHTVSYAVILRNLSYFIGSVFHI